MKYTRKIDKKKLLQMFHQSVSTVVIIGFFLFINNSFRIIMVRGNSMLPTFRNGQIILVDTRKSAWKFGDVIVFTPQHSSTNNEFMIKRVIGTGGDVVAINYDSKSVSVNGNELDEPYVNHTSIAYSHEINVTGVVVFSIPAGSFFVMGDNRNRSLDSRNSEIGFISSEHILGKVIIDGR